MKSQGYILIALGESYIKEAEMCAKTIRKYDQRPICVLTLNEHLHLIDRNLFNDVVEYKIVNNYFNYFKTPFEIFGTYAKINLISFSPYEETIYLDSDVVCQFSPENLWQFASNRKNPIMMMGQKEDPSWHFGHIESVSLKYGKKIPHTHGGFVYFRKDSLEFFNYCNELVPNYDSLDCKRWYKNSMPDEIFFAIAHAKFDYDPIEFDEYPIMTFNITENISLPTKLQTHNNKILEDYIPFIHAYDRNIFKELFLRVMNMTTHDTPHIFLRGKNDCEN